MRKLQYGIKEGGGDGERERIEEGEEKGDEVEGDLISAKRRAS